MFAVTWDVETQEGEYLYRYQLFNFLEKTLKLLIYSTLWASDMESQNVWFLIIPICTIRNKKTNSFFLNYKYVLWINGQLSRMAVYHIKKYYFEIKVQKIDHFPGMYLFFDRLGVLGKSAGGGVFFGLFDRG